MKNFILIALILVSTIIIAQEIELPQNVKEDLGTESSSGNYKRSPVVNTEKSITKEQDISKEKGISNEQYDMYFTNETCYAVIVLSNVSWSKPLTMIKVPIFEVPCCKGSTVTLSSDMRKQFFYFLHKNYRSYIEIFKGKNEVPGHIWIYSWTTEEYVLKKRSNYYRSKIYEEYDKIVIDGFKYEPGKFLTPNYSAKELYEMYMEIDRYFKKGIEISIIP